MDKNNIFSLVGLKDLEREESRWTQVGMGHVELIFVPRTASDYTLKTLGKLVFESIPL